MDTPKNIIAVRLKEDLAWVTYDDFENNEYKPTSHQIIILRKGLVIGLSEAGGTSVVVSLLPHKFKFPIQVFWNNPHYFEPIYVAETEKPPKVPDVVRANFEMRLTKVEKELTNLNEEIIKWK